MSWQMTEIRATMPNLKNTRPSKPQASMKYRAAGFDSTNQVRFPSLDHDFDRLTRYQVIITSRVLARMNSPVSHSSGGRPHSTEYSARTVDGRLSRDISFMAKSH